MQVKTIKTKLLVIGVMITILVAGASTLQVETAFAQNVSDLEITPSATTTEWSIQTDLSLASASFRGSVSGDMAGQTVACVGDVNNDGFDDFTIGNPNSGSGAGAIYLLFGKTGPWYSNFLLGAADVILTGEVPGASAGTSVAALGDVNNDGYDDIGVGVNSNQSASRAGKVYIVLGRPTYKWPSSMSLSQANASYLGEHAYDYASTIAGAGDVNGDGFTDVLVAASNCTTGGLGGVLNMFGAGKVYLLFGRSSSGWMKNVPLSQANVTFIGDAGGDFLGSICGAGDLNDDTLDDFLVGASLRNYPSTGNGMVYVMFGRATAAWQTNLRIGASANASFYGESDSSYAGSTLQAAGDVDGNGCDDFLVGVVAEHKVAGVPTGKVYVVKGQKTASSWHANVSLAALNDSFRGEAGNDQAGCSLAGAGDVNNDSYADFLIGAYGSDALGRTGAGQVYLLYGGAGIGWGKNVTLREANASFVGWASNDDAGRSCAMGGDVNGDGVDDFFIGTPEAGISGSVYLFFGQPAQTPPEEVGEDPWVWLTPQNILLIGLAVVTVASFLLNVVVLIKIRRKNPPPAPTETDRR